MALAHPLHTLNVEDLHPHTQELLRSLLMSDRMNVERFLSDLLNQATRTAGSGERGQEQYASLQTQSIQMLSRSIGWNFTTTYKLIKVLEALGLLTMHSSKQGCHLWISLAAPPLTTAQMQERVSPIMQSHTPKVRQLATKVSARLQQLLPQKPSGSTGDGVTQIIEDELTLLFHHCGIQLHDSMQKHLRQTAQTLAGKLERISLAAPASYDSRGQAVMGYGERSVGNSNGAMSVEGSTEQAHSGSEFPSVAPTGKVIPLSPSLLGQVELPSTGEFVRSLRLRDALEFPSTAPKLPSTGEFSCQEGNLAPLTLDRYRNITSSKRKNDNVPTQKCAHNETVGRELAELVEKSPRNARAYAHYLEQHEERLVRAVLLYTQQQGILKEQSRRPIEHPGKYFNGMIKRWGAFGSYEAACEAYARDKADPERTTTKVEGIPEDIQALIEEMSSWSYTDVAQEVCLRTHAWLRGDVSAPSADEQVHGSGQQESLEPRPTAYWMISEEEAQRLAEQILREAPLIEADLRIRQIRPYRRRGTQHTVFLVDVLQEGMPEVYASQEQWRDYFEGIQDLMRRYLI